MLASLLSGDGTVFAPVSTRAQLPLLLNQYVTAQYVKTGSGAAALVGSGADAVTFTEAGYAKVGTVGSGSLRPLRNLAGGGVAGLTTAQNIGGTVTTLPELVVEIDVTNDPTGTTRTWTDITAYVRQISWRQSGRSHELQRSEAGTLSMTLSNRDGRFDPTNTGGAYYPGFKRMRWVRVSGRWGGQTFRRWQGVVESIRQEWPNAGKDSLTIVGCVDAFKILNLVDLEGQQFTADTTGGRVNDVLAVAGLTAGDVNTGISSVVALNGGEDPDNPGTYLVLPAGTTALSHLQAVEETENGQLVAEPDGTVSFQSRHYRTLLQTTSAATIGDSTGEIPYVTASLSNDDGDLWNTVTVTTSDDQKVTATDGASVTAHFARKLSRSILNTDTVEALSAAQYLVYKYADPDPRLPVVNLVGRAEPTNWPTILGLGTSDRLTWKRRPMDAVRTITQTVHVEQITETVVPGTNWEVQLQLSPSDKFVAWVLDTAQLGTDSILTY